MTPASILELLQKGGLGVAALALAAMTVVFFLFKAAMDARILDLKEQVAAARTETGVAREAFRANLAVANASLDRAHDAETAALRLTIPLSEKLAVAVGMLEAKNRRRADPPPPPPAAPSSPAAPMAAEAK